MEFRWWLSTEHVINVLARLQAQPIEVKGKRAENRALRLKTRGFAG